MKKVIGLLAFTFYALINLALLAAFISLSTGNLTFDEIKIFFSDYNLNKGIWGIGALIISINFLLFLIIITRTTKAKNLVFKTSGGETAVSIKGIRTVIKQLTKEILNEEDSGIKKIRTHINTKGNNLEVIFKAELYSNISIPDVTEQIHHEVKNRLQEILGAGSNIKIRINVNKIHASSELSSDDEIIEKET
ncbi:MAG: alkaline shock response membrane anchor protein AmaP [Candidatus Omnitrophota bacterium]